MRIVMSTTSDVALPLHWGRVRDENGRFPLIEKIWLMSGVKAAVLFAGELLFPPVGSAVQRSTGLDWSVSLRMDSNRPSSPHTSSSSSSSCSPCSQRTHHHTATMRWPGNSILNGRELRTKSVLLLLSHWVKQQQQPTVPIELLHNFSPLTSSLSLSLSVSLSLLLSVFVYLALCSSLPPSFRQLV